MGPHVLLFRRPLGTDPQTGLMANSANTASLVEGNVTEKTLLSSGTQGSAKLATTTIAKDERRSSVAMAVSILGDCTMSQAVNAKKEQKLTATERTEPVAEVPAADPTKEEKSADVTQPPE